jgi:hypothetical protein
MQCFIKIKSCSMACHTFSGPIPLAFIRQATPIVSDMSAWTRLGSAAAMDIYRHLGDFEGKC